MHTDDDDNNNSNTTTGLHHHHTADSASYMQLKSGVNNSAESNAFEHDIILGTSSSSINPLKRSSSINNLINRKFI